jgi:hypothetical protein
MATVLYGLNLGQNEYQVTLTNPSTAVFANDFEIKIDLAKITNSADVQAIISILENYIIKNWHP